MLIDTHCHLSHEEFAADIPGILSRAAAAGVVGMITIATDMDDAQDVMARFADYPQVALGAGIHPHQAATANDAQLSSLIGLHRGETVSDQWRERLVAVGETGLDFHYDFAPPDMQERVFRAQLDLACEVNKPVVIHARKSEGRVCDILADYPALSGRVVFHCYSSGAEMARRILDLGFWLSFTGVVTFRNAAELRDVIRRAPLDRMMVETDAPYLTPEPLRKHRPNEPAFVVHTARLIAEAREIPMVELAAATTANAKRFFRLPEDFA